MFCIEQQEEEVEEEEDEPELVKEKKTKESLFVNSLVLLRMLKKAYYAKLFLSFLGLLPLLLLLLPLILVKLEKASYLSHRLLQFQVLPQSLLVT